MKHLYAILLSLFFFTSHGTHLMGGEITVAQLPNGQHLVNLLVYRDTVGIPMQSTALFEFKGPNGLSFTHSVAYDSVISGNLLPMYPYGVEIYLFSDTVSFPSIGMWDISWVDCCRNAAIQNITNPLGDAMYLTTSLWVDSIANNSTAFFLVPAAIYLPLNTPWQYNPLPFDPDGDSLVWSLDQPLKDSGVYCAGYTTPPAAANNPLTLDSATGTISWTANTIGHFVISILVDQYRNGIWIGEIRRDMQLIVVPAHGGFPFWHSMNGQSPRDTISVNVPASTPMNFEIVASHLDPNIQLYMEAYSSLIQNGDTSVSFTVAPTGSGNNIKGTFSFQPNASHVHQTHLVVFRCSDGYFTTDQTLSINVRSGLGIEESSPQAYSAWQVYPNPMSDFFRLSFQAIDAEDLKLEVLSLDGKVMMEEELSSKAGLNVYQIQNTNLQPGVYLLQLTGSQGLLLSEKLIKN